MTLKCRMDLTNRLEIHEDTGEGMLRISAGVYVFKVQCDGLVNAENNYEAAVLRYLISDSVRLTMPLGVIPSHVDRCL